MATTPKTTTKVVEQCRVSPPPATVSPTTLPLTFFDVVWLFTGHVKLILFYQSTGITTHAFLRSHLPALSHSLSLTLQSFFSVSVAESDADFAALMADEAKDVTLTHPLVPVLSSDPHEHGRSPLVALQFTVFPGADFTLGITFHHAAADGDSIHRFLKSWAAIHRSGGDRSSAPDAPVYERGSLLELDDDKKGFLGDVMRVNPAVMETHMEELPAKTTTSLLGHDGKQSEPRLF